MEKNRIKQLWREGKATVGTWLALGSPIVAEIIAHIGFDWVVIDTEHQRRYGRRLCPRCPPCWNREGTSHL